MRLMTRLTIVILALMLALPTVSCQPKEKVKENGKGLEVQVETGKTSVKVEGSNKPDEKGRHLEVDVEHHADHGPESGGRDK
jgi:hypothetical protein